MGREVSTATTFRCLWEMGFRCRKPATKPLLNYKHKLKQLQWANMHKDGTSEQCSKVIFSDQFKFYIEFGDRGILVWRTKDENYNPACLKRSVKFPTSVMVWGGVGLCMNKRNGQYRLPQINSYKYTILCISKC